MTTNHEKNVRDKAAALKDAITDAQAAGLRVDLPLQVSDLHKVAISETAASHASVAAGDGFDALDKTALQKLCAARGLSTTGNMADLIAALRAPPQTGTHTPKATTTIVP